MSQPQLRQGPGAEELVCCPWCTSSKANRALFVPKKKVGSAGGIHLRLENVLSYHVWEFCFSLCGERREAHVGQGLLLCSRCHPFILSWSWL